MFTGNWMGALYGALPNFYTLRGDRQRSVAQFLRDIDRVIGWRPELLLTGHDDPVRGADLIETDLTKIRAAVTYIHDEMVKGMNAHKDLFTLMREIDLPPHLEPAPGRGPTRWYVRAVWEEYAGWFRHESTTELYGVPPRAIWTDLIELSGGPGALTERARRHLNAGHPVEALHLTDLTLSVEPGNRLAREVEIDALERLIDQTQGKTFDELAWLEVDFERAIAALADK